MIVRAKSARTVAGFEMSRQVAYETAQLIAIAVNEPAKLPKYQPLKRAAEAPAERSGEVMWAKLRGYLMYKSARPGGGT